MALKTFSHQTVIVPIHQNRAIFRDTCFLKIPAIDQSVLKDLQILVLVQFPIMTSDLVQVSDEQGNRIDTDQVRRQLGIGPKIDQGHLVQHSDLISFKTEYIAEIPLYDPTDESVMRVSNDARLTFKRFTTRGFSIKKQNPLATLPDEPNVVLSYGADVLSMFFTHERPLNKIITVYDQKKNLTDVDINFILSQTKEIAHPTLLFHAEKLLSVLINIFQHTESPDGSSDAFEAILYVVNFFRSAQRQPKDQRVVDDFITKRMSNYQAHPVYPKILFQMLRFAEHLEQSLESGRPVGCVRQHFTLFKELPTICSFLRKSFELEERQMEVRLRANKKQQQRDRRKLSAKHVPTFGDVVRQQQEKQPQPAAQAAETADPGAGGTSRFLANEASKSALAASRGDGK